MVRRIFDIVALVTFLMLAVVFWTSRGRPMRVWPANDYFIDGSSGDIELLRGVGSGYQRVIVVPTAMMATLAVLPLILWFLRLRRAHTRKRLREAAQRAGRCAQCGYDLRATPDRCPECGNVPPTRKPRPQARRQIIIHGLEDRWG